MPPTSLASSSLPPVSPLPPESSMSPFSSSPTKVLSKSPVPLKRIKKKLNPDAEVDEVLLNYINSRSAVAKDPEPTNANAFFFKYIEMQVNTLPMVEQMEVQAEIQTIVLNKITKYIDK